MVVSKRKRPASVGMLASQMQRDVLAEPRVILPEYRHQFDALSRQHRKVSVSTFVILVKVPVKTWRQVYSGKPFLWLPIGTGGRMPAQRKIWKNEVSIHLPLSFQRETATRLGSQAGNRAAHGFFGESLVLAWPKRSQRRLVAPYALAHSLIGGNKEACWPSC